METAFIVFGGTIFWLISIVFFIALVVSVEYDNGWYATGITVAMLLALTFGVDINIFTWVWNNPILTVQYIGGYFLAGTIWAIAKWWFYCLKLLDVVKNIKADFLFSAKITDNVIPDSHRAGFNKMVAVDGRYHDMYYPPQALNHKSDWLMWATWWPVSFFWTLLNQPIKEIWMWIYARLGGLMQKISNAVFSNV